MLEDFAAWLSGIFEDAPIPSEIKNIYFCLHSKNNHNYISFGGNQFESKLIFNFEYYPLEAQYFNAEIYEKEFDIIKLRTLIYKILNKSFFRDIFLNINIFVCYFGSKYFFKLEN